MPVRYDTNGHRFRDFRSAVDAMSGDRWDDWPVDGPQTFAWDIRFMANQGGTPTGWHSEWKSDGKLDASSHIVAFHGVCCQMIETLLCYDQLNGVNVATGELLMRQVMLAEERLKGRFGNQSQTVLTSSTSTPAAAIAMPSASVRPSRSMSRRRWPRRALCSRSDAKPARSGPWYDQKRRKDAG